MMSRGTKRYLMSAGVVAMLVAVVVPILRHALGLAPRPEPCPRRPGAWQSARRQEGRGGR